jgi:hypothetical protein
MTETLSRSNFELYKLNLVTVQGVRYQGNQYGGTFVFGEMKTPLINVRLIKKKLEVTIDESSKSAFIKPLRERFYEIAQELR